MKTMREVDDEHRPSEFVKRFGYQTLDDGVAMVIDFSHESPVYNPSALEEAGVEYHKFPTVSKQVPRAEEVEQFIALVDELRQTGKLRPKDNGVHPTIAVHCHYGYNRTGTSIQKKLVSSLRDVPWREARVAHPAAVPRRRPAEIRHDIPLFLLLIICHGMSELNFC